MIFTSDILYKHVYPRLHKYFPGIPLPVRLPYGIWWLIQNDIASITVMQDEWECGERKFITQFLKRGMVFFDIGAHLGFYTLLASRLVTPRGKVVAFEPNPYIKRRLVWHLILNRCTNVHLEEVAVGDRTGKADFFILADRSDLSSLQVHPRCFASHKISKIIVQMTSLDDYVMNNNITKIDFIKVDVEGAEWLVLKGATRLEFRPIWLVELLNVNTAPFGYSADQVVNFMIQKGFYWFFLTREGRLLPLNRLKNITFDDVNHRNFVAVPVERLQEIQSFLVDA